MTVSFPLARTCGLRTRRHCSTPVPAQQKLVAPVSWNLVPPEFFVKVLAFEVCFVLLVFVIKRFKARLVGSSFATLATPSYLLLQNKIVSMSCPPVSLAARSHLVFELPLGSRKRMFTTLRLQSTFLINPSVCSIVHVFSHTDTTGKVAYPAAGDLMTNVFVCY